MPGDIHQIPAMQKTSNLDRQRVTCTPCCSSLLRNVVVGKSMCSVVALLVLLVGTVPAAQQSSMQGRSMNTVARTRAEPGRTLGQPEPLRASTCRDNTQMLSE